MDDRNSSIFWIDPPGFCSRVNSRPKALKGLEPTLRVKDSARLYSRFDFYVVGNQLYVYQRSSWELSNYYLIINGFRQRTALQVISALPIMGSKFESGLLRIYKEQGLNLGWTDSPVRGREL